MERGIDDAVARAAIESAAQAIEAEAVRQAQAAANAHELGMDGMAQLARAVEAAHQADARRVRGLLVALGL